MSDTPRTDAISGWSVTYRGKSSSEELYIDPKGPFVHSTFARQLERELDEANHRIRRLIEERDTARMQADRNYKLREEFQALLGTDDVAVGVANIKHAQRQAARYEVVRRMNHLEFNAIIHRCVRQDLRFDDEVDRIGGIK